MLAVADGKPETLGLKAIIEHHIDFQFELATRKYKNLLGKEKAKQEIQEGLIKACDVIDLIIEILRGSKSRDQVKKCLVEGITEGIRFGSKTSEKAAAKLHFTENQANAILDMRLYKLIGLEIEALEAEHAQTLKNITVYEDILTNYRSMAKVIIKDLDRLKKEYAVPRKTSIENAKAAVFEEKKMEEAEVVVLIDRFGYTRSVDRSVYERNKESADAENRFVVHCLNTDKLCIFTDTGKLHLLKAAELPYGRFRDKGTPLDNLCNYASAQEEILRIEGLNTIRGKQILFATEQAMLKKVEGSEFDVSKRTIAATKLGEDDKLVGVYPVGTEEQIVLQSTDGYFLRFPLEEVPVKKKAAIGVRGMKMNAKDHLQQVHLLTLNGDDIAYYKEKEVHLNRLRISKRDAKAVKTRV